MSRLWHSQNPPGTHDCISIISSSAIRLTGLAEDVRKGLSAQPKRFLPKYFYDELGSQLFEAICLLPEYYLTRAENEILQALFRSRSWPRLTVTKHWSRWAAAVRQKHG